MSRGVAQIANAAAVSVRWYGNTALIASVDAEVFIRACGNRQRLIVGIEGFRVCGDARTPDMGWIADWSAASDVGEAMRESVSFVREAPRDLYFEFDLNEPVP